MPYLQKDRRIDSDSRDAGQTKISLNPAGGNQLQWAREVRIHAWLLYSSVERDIISLSSKAPGFKIPGNLPCL